jgi:hypothetical protein
VSETVDAVGRIELRFFKVALEELLDSTNLEIALPASKESFSFRIPYFKVRLKQLFHGPKKRLLSADAAFYSVDIDSIVFKVNIVQPEKHCFRDPESVVIDGGKQDPVSSVVNLAKQFF